MTYSESRGRLGVHLTVDSESLQQAQRSTGVSQRARHRFSELETGPLTLLAVEPSEADEYHGGAREIHLHFGWKFVGAHRAIPFGAVLDADYCAIFQKLGDGRSVGLGTQGNAVASEGHHHIQESRSECRQFAVLVGVVESADDSEDMPVGDITMVKRLQRYDDCTRLRIDATDRPLEVVPNVIVLDHEVSIRALGEDVMGCEGESRSVAPLPFGDRRNDNVVEGTSQVVYEVTDNEGEHGVRLIGNAQPPFDRAIWVRFDDTLKPIWVEAIVPPYLTFDLYHVLLCTPELQPPGLGHGVNFSYGQADTEDGKRLRDSRPDARRSGSRVQEGDEGGEAQEVSDPPPEEVASRTATARQSGGCTAKRTHSGSPEDA